MRKKRQTDPGLRHGQSRPGIVTDSLNGRRYALADKRVVKKGLIPPIDDQRISCQFPDRDLSVNTETVDVADRDKGFLPERADIQFVQPERTSQQRTVQHSLVQHFPQGE